MRRFARRHVPRPIRLAIALLRRSIEDALAGHRFASARATPEAFPQPLQPYALPLIVYPGQEAVAEAKRNNSALLAEALNGTVLESGEVWSLWHLAGAPTRAKGYGKAAAIVNGELTTAVGGAVCLVSTVVFNAGLLAGLDVVERHQHSVDTYGERRYFQLGRDSTIEYGYLDLRFANPYPYPLRLSVRVADDEVRATFHAACVAPPTVEVEVRVDRSHPAFIRTETRRTTSGPMLPTRTWLGHSLYRIPGATEGTAIIPAANPLLS